VQEEGVKQIRNSNSKQNVANPIVDIPFAKHFCYLYKQTLNFFCAVMVGAFWGMATLRGCLKSYEEANFMPIASP